MRPFREFENRDFDKFIIEVEVWPKHALFELAGRMMRAGLVSLMPTGKDCAVAILTNAGRAELKRRKGE